MIGFGDFSIYQQVVDKLGNLPPVIQLGIVILVALALIAVFSAESSINGKRATGNASGKYRSSDLKTQRDGDHVTITNARTGAVLFDGSKETEKEWRKANMAPAPVRRTN